MDQTEEPMELDQDVTFTEVDKFEASIESKLQQNDSDDEKVQETVVPLQETRYENRGGTFTTGIDIFSEEEKLKMEERAKRFGLTDKVNNTLVNQEQDLYSSLGVVEENENVKELRLNTLHMRGTKEMSTKDVFKYFEDYAPASIEWINDVSCNVVWLDNVSAARALLRLSKRIDGLGDKVRADKNSKLEESSYDDENNVANDDCVVEVIEEDAPMEGTGDKQVDDAINIKDIVCPLPPGLWRKGVDCPKSKNILLRFATRADKKQPNAEKKSEYYKKYGNPNFGGVKGILTESRKRMYKEIRQSRKKAKEAASDDETDPKPPKNPWGDLSENWGVNDSVEDDFISKSTNKDLKSNVKERLGFRPQPKEIQIQSEESGSSSESDSSDEWCKRSKVLRMRMHADDEEKKVQKRRSKLQNQVHTNTINRGDDLRSRLGRPRRTTPVFPASIQVVVTNTQVGSPDSPKTDRSEEEGEEEEGEIVEEVMEEEKEEGEWQEEDSVEEDNDDEDDSNDSEESGKEIQGPKGSVIKVVQHKPRLASTVWARLNHKQPEESKTPEHRRPTRGDLRETLRGGDLRSRLGKPTRGRSPLRIEVKNDKFTQEDSNTE